MGFTFDDTAAAKGEAEIVEDMRRLLKTFPRNAERIKPYIGGEEVNNSPNHAHHRYAIDFEDLPLRRDCTAPSPWYQLSDETQRAMLRSGLVSGDYPFPVAADWPELLKVVENRVRPFRSDNKRERYVNIWWQYAEKRPGLNSATKNIEHVLVLSRISPHLAIGRVSSKLVFAESIVVLTFPTFAPFAVLQSRVHEIWARFFSSSMKDDLRYAPSDCLETFPFPPGYEFEQALEAVSQTYHDHRSALMVAANEGMTKTYNRFHKSEEGSDAIRHLREFHDEMDRAVLHSYGWDDLAEELRPEFLNEETEDDHTYQNRYFWPAEARDRVLARLLVLNAERHAGEVAEGSAPVGPVQARDPENAESEPQLDLS